jgi:hypothetical protein
MRCNDGSNHLLFAILLAACETVEGGAAELSWKFRPSSSALEDKFVECNSGKPGTNPIVAMRLEWQVVGQPVDVEEWPCGDSHGVTGFALPPGPTLFSVVPICESGPAESASYIAPAVEQRNVILGDTVSLGAVELVVQVTECGATTCICE